VAGPPIGGVFGSPRNRQAVRYPVWSIPSMRKRKYPERTSRPVCRCRTREVANGNRKARPLRVERTHRRELRPGVHTERPLLKTARAVLEEQVEFGPESHVPRCPKDLVPYRDFQAAHASTTRMPSFCTVQ
jgi:hypothetical protein